MAKDIEMNRPGQKGFRSPATKKAAKEKEVCPAYLQPYPERNASRPLAIVLPRCLYST